MTDSIFGFPCPNDGCENGKIEVYNAYAADPLIPTTQPCDICAGRGFVVFSDSEVLSSIH